MAIADTVWERLARFNAPYRRNGGPGPRSYGNAALRVIASAGEWLLAGLQVLSALLATVGLLLGRVLFWLLRALGRLLWYRVLPFSGRALARGTVASWRAFPGFVLGFRWVILGACVGLLGWLASVEMRNSHWQAWAFSRLNKGLGYTVEAGAHPIARFPKSGPYDERLGYTQLPAFISSLVSHRYGVDAQARWSPGLERFVGLGTFPIYREKDKAGLRIFDRGGEQTYGVQFPERIFPDYASMPQLAVRSLLFIEDRYLFDERNPERNPAIEWNRFGLAAATRLASIVIPGLHEGGGSTLATQIEKFRHSPHGVTGGVGEKLRQMLTASARAYSQGPDTFKRREEIVTTYMNSTPLASMPGYGEVIGIPEALWVWFGTDHVEATKILNSTPRNPRELARKGLVYRQVLSLILSERRPTYYLLQNRDALAVLTDKYLRGLCEAGIIDPALRDAALDAELTFRTEPPPISMVSWVKEKAVQDVRYKLVSLLKLPDLYSLDRLDLAVESSVDTAAQSRITAVMQRLGDPAYLRQAGLIGHQLLGDGNPAKLTWSFVLYERGNDVNHVRIHADSANRPFDLNSGAKLQLGSTAKLRTMITYLTIISELHGKLSGLPVKDLLRTAAAAEDPLTQWAAGYLARNRDRGLQPMLDAAMQRTYSAAPETFFTGGGNQSFGNFESWEDSGAPTVENAFQHSINLAFVRILKDVVT
jgi:membrane peptidoglycan carboxypeptidase